MHQGKIDNFKSYYDVREFPWYRELSFEECTEIRSRLKDNFRLNTSIGESLELLKELHGTAEFISGVNAEKDDFSLDALVKKLGIKCLSEVYINWFRFDQIDKLHFEDLTRYFDDIWYPAADDIKIFDDSFEWLLFVDHDGFISLAKP